MRISDWSSDVCSSDLDALLLDDLDVLQCGGAANRMAGIGVAVVEQQIRRRLGAQALQQAVGDEAGAERQVAGSEPLGTADHVRLEAEHVLAGEPLPEASEGGDHTVGDEDRQSTRINTSH